MKDRRQEERISTDLPIIACSPSIHPDSRITNMSNTGAFITTSHPLPVDTVLALHFQLPGAPEIMAINACVVWTKSVSNINLAGMGIEYTDLLPEDQKKLIAFIEQNTPSNSSQG